MSCLTDPGVTGKAFPSLCGRPPGGGLEGGIASATGRSSRRAGGSPRSERAASPPHTTHSDAETGTGGETRRPLRGQRPQVWQREAPRGRGLGPKSQQSWAGDQVSRAFPGAGRGPGPLPAQSPDPPAVSGHSLLPDVTRSEGAGSVQVTTWRP